ncbi:Uncharacterized protein BP5553_06553 [Venustampulla echinocandica]|uniref:NAD(P)-binding domain-containing protein n=1 Tax=Venustampulla echinocandica TaxID=2656787 RepID=A0A370TK84_9HELO|nr:Uncharacterized protein BP5553_06553 [Venustampulla echinocandica]RDL35941.1 Uncharacterized protein BP5553_06553 [Venustampulla echinocandica]
MRVLLLGATGNLGSRLIPALLVHKHTVTIYIRSISKLHKLISPSLIPLITIVIGDATDSVGIKKAILDHDCEAICDVAGNQVLPWREHLLEKIAKAVTDAAVAVGEERGEQPMRIWLIGGIGLCRYPGTDNLIQDYMPKPGIIQHQETLNVVTPISLSKLRWSLLCVGMMVPARPKIEPLSAPRRHKLLLKDGEPPAWKDSYLRRVPLIGDYLNVVPAILNHTTELEDVADFLAEDLELGSTEWLGKSVGLKQKETDAA